MQDKGRKHREMRLLKATFDSSQTDQNIRLKSCQNLYERKLNIVSVNLSELVPQNHLRAITK